MDGFFVSDEENMIPKGLLDISLEKFEESTGLPVEYQAINGGMPFSMPCFIAVIPADPERTLNNFNQSSGLLPFPDQLQQMTPNYTRPQFNDCVYPKSARGFSNTQQQRNIQNIDYPWWGQSRSNQNMHPSTSQAAMELRVNNNTRNPNSMFMDRMYVPYQPIMYNRYPFEYHQGITNVSPPFTYGYEGYVTKNICHSHCAKPPNKNAIKSDKEQQTDQAVQTEPNDSTNQVPILFRGDQLRKECSCPGSSISSFEECNFSEVCDNNLDPPQTQKFHSFPSGDLDEIVYNGISDQSTFYDVALTGCLRLEELFLTINMTPHTPELRHHILTLKNSLKHTINSAENNNAFQEMIFAFIQLCNSWISLDHIRKLDIKKRRFMPLVDQIQSWESKSKFLLESIILTIHNIPREEQTLEKPAIQKITNNFKEKVSLSMTSCMETPDNHDFLNYNWRQNSPSQSVEIDKSKCKTCLLYPETHKPFNETGSECDNMLKTLKRNHEKNNSKVGNGQRYSNQVSKSQQNASPRRKFTSTTTQNYKEMHFMSETPYDKSQTDNLKRNKTPQPNQHESFQPNSDFTNFSKSGNHKKSNDSIKNMNQKFPGRVNEKYERSETFNFDGYSQPGLLYQERNKLIDAHMNNLRKKDLESDKTKTEMCYNMQNDKRYNHQTKMKPCIPNDSMPQCSTGEKLNPSLKTKLYEVLGGIRTEYLRKSTNADLTSNDLSEAQLSLVNPITNIAQLLMKNYYKTTDEVVGSLLSTFYQAKFDNKGNIDLLTLANVLELKLIGTVYEEIRKS